MPKVPESLISELESLGLERILPFFEASMQHSIRLTIDSQSEDPVSRLGGSPNLPGDISWPVNASGNPLAFLAQLDLARLPRLAGLELPTSGSLFFFYDNENQPWGFDPADASGSKVVYVDVPLSSIPLREMSDTLREEDRFPGMSWIGTLDQTYAQLDHKQIRELEISDGEFEQYLYLSVFQGPCHRMGGQPDEIQNDMRLEVQLVANGIYCGHSDAYDSEEALRLAPGAEDWELLLQIDSEESASMMWGDVGRLYFWIRKADLANRNFDGVRTVLQCG